MKLLLDMNVSPLCGADAMAEGHEVVHWSAVGGPRSPDTEIMAWARSHAFVVVTHDLDFAQVLGITNADGPSVVQIRAKRMAVPILSKLIAEAVAECAFELDRGAIVTLDMLKRRVRALPLHDPDNFGV